jgi:hypothetical protein
MKATAAVFGSPDLGIGGWASSELGVLSDRSIISFTIKFKALRCLEQIEGGPIIFDLESDFDRTDGQSPLCSSDQLSSGSEKAPHQR